MALYRIAQEAIHNAVTHGHARHIVIRLAEVGDYLSLCIRDDGKGFKPDVRSGSGMGLRIMQYRANSVGGRLSVHSSGGGGTEVECLVAKRLCLSNRKETRKDTFAGK
jgi:signal transduction histidine kinase